MFKRLVKRQSLSSSSLKEEEKCRRENPRFGALGEERRRRRAQPRAHRHRLVDVGAVIVVRSRRHRPSRPSGRVGSFARVTHCGLNSQVTVPLDLLGCEPMN